MDADPLDAALYYARRGWFVFPIWPIDPPLPGEPGRCTCPDPDCASPGKHPMGSLVPNGVKDASRDPATLRQWLSLVPDANLGIATGTVSRLVVLDIDPDRDGIESLADLQERHGRLPRTLTVITGGGGLHHYFGHPGGLRCSVGGIQRGLAPGIDVRADGGYVVAPSSRHVSGNRYRWDAGGHPKRTRLAALPPWLEELIRGPARAAPPLPEVIPVGARDDTLTSVAGSMRARGCSEAAIEAALLVENGRCEEPLPEDQVRKIARSVGRYVPAPTIVRHAPIPVFRQPDTRPPPKAT